MGRRGRGLIETLWLERICVCGNLYVCECVCVCAYVFRERGVGVGGDRDRDAGDQQWLGGTVCLNRNKRKKKL